MFRCRRGLEGLAPSLCQKYHLRRTLKEKVGLPLTPKDWTESAAGMGDWLQTEQHGKNTVEKKQEIQLERDC